MTISESKRLLNIPVEPLKTIEVNEMLPVTAVDFYGEFGAHKRVAGIMTVETADILSLRGQSRFSDKHFYSKDQINKLGIEKREKKQPFRKTAVVWRPE